MGSIEWSRPKPSFHVNSRVKASPTAASRSLLPSISETHSYTSRPYVATRSPPSLDFYRTPVSTTSSNYVTSPRVNVRDTANIDVVTRPTPRPTDDRPIKRDFTVGTLKRGRRVIRLQTSRLPLDQVTRADSPRRRSPEGSPSPRRASPEGKLGSTSPAPLRRLSPAAPAPRRQQPAVPTGAPLRRLSPVDTNIAAVRPKQRPYGVAAVAAAAPVQPVVAKKTPGQRLKEKFLLPSRKGAVRKPGAVFADSGLGSSPVVTTPTSLRRPVRTPERNSRLISTSAVSS